MALAADLGYHHPPRTLVRRAIAAVFATKVGSAIVRPFIGSADRLVLRWTQGNTALSQWFVGLSVLLVKSIGARSGQTRETPLYGIPIEGDLGLIGSALAQKQTPAWVYNLEANPDVVLAYNGVEVPARARPATEDEEPIIWATAKELYAGYSKYVERAAHRQIRVFVLEPAPLTAE